MTFEKWAERDMKKKAKEMGGHAYKFTSSGENGLPDRLFTVPPAVAWFVELKSLGQEPSALQTIQMERLIKRGAHVLWINSPELLQRFYTLVSNEQKFQRGLNYGHEI